jgi:hypothetical protein
MLSVVMAMYLVKIVLAASPVADRLRVLELETKKEIEHVW